MGKAQILVVEDESVIAMDLQSRLIDFGYAVPATATSGKEAIRKVEDSRSDLVLMDIQLKGDMDGVETAEIIRSRFNIPVIYLTAHADEVTLKRAKITTPFGYLLKPLNERDLEITIEMALSKSKMERDLRESQRWLDTILNSIGDAVIATDAQNRITFMNPVAEAVTGWTQDEVLGKDAGQVLHSINKDTRTPIERHAIKVLKEGMVEDVEDGVLLIAKNGMEIPISERAAPIRTDQGDIIGVVWSFRDVTQRVDLEEQLDVIHQLGRELTLLRDETAIVQRALKAVASVLQFEIADYGLVDEEAGELVYRYHLVGGVPKATRMRLSLAGYRGIGVAVARSGQPLNVPDTSQDARYVPLPGRRPSLSELCVPIKLSERTIGVLNAESVKPNRFTLADQQLLQTLADQIALALENARLYQNVQDQMRTLQETQAQLIQSEKLSALGRLVASIAHEINNPLQAVQGCLALTRERLEEDSLASAGRTGESWAMMARYVGTAESEAERIAAIVRRVRDFYRPAREGRAPTDVHALLRSVLELTSWQMQERNVSLDALWASDLPMVQANTDHLQQVFLTLVLNALDAMPHGGTLRIATGLAHIQRHDPLADSGIDTPPIPALRVDFSDTGVGMSPEAQAHLFEPFFSTKAHQTGLGLAISYRIIASHNGQITVESQKGRGSSFSVLLPTAPDPLGEGKQT